MYGRRKYRRSYKGRRNGRKKVMRPRRKYYKSRVVSPRNTFGGFPQTKMTRLRYCDTVTIDPGAAIIGYYSFRANGIYDPDQTSTGHQPMGRDIWAQIYNRYVVLGAKITATFSPQEKLSHPYIYGIKIDDDGATVPLNVSELVESGQSKYRMANNDYTVRGPQSITKYFSAKKWFNVSNVKDNVTRIGAPIGADPADIASFLLWVGPAGHISDSSPWHVTVKIEYIVLFTEPQDQYQN